MITKHNLDKVETYTEIDPIIHINTLNHWGIHIGDIAYLIEIGKLVPLKNGYYKYQHNRKKEIPNPEISQPSSEAKVTLNLLVDEEKHVEIDTSEPDWTLLEQISRKLECTKGIVILKPMNKKRRHNIYQLTRGIPCLLPFPIGTDSTHKRVVLQYRTDDVIDIKKRAEEADIAYQQKQFKQCISAYLEVISHSQKIYPYFYARLGFAYMQTFQTKKAITYLTIADGLYKKVGKNKDFTELIEKLSKTETKNIYAETMDEDFYSYDNNYGLEAFDEMAVLVASGKTIEEVAIIFSLTEEQISLFMLVLARNCYTNEDYKSGDAYLKQVEQRKPKTPQIRQLLNEIRKNKRFYKNRKPGESQILTFVKQL